MKNQKIDIKDIVDRFQLEEFNIMYYSTGDMTITFKHSGQHHLFFLNARNYDYDSLVLRIQRIVQLSQGWNDVQKLTPILKT